MSAAFKCDKCGNYCDNANFYLERDFRPNGWSEDLSAALRFKTIDGKKPDYCPPCLRALALELFSSIS